MIYLIVMLPMTTTCLQTNAPETNSLRAPFFFSKIQFADVIRTRKTESTLTPHDAAEIKHVHHHYTVSNLNLFRKLRHRSYFRGAKKQKQKIDAYFG